MTRERLRALLLGLTLIAAGAAFAAGITVLTSSIASPEIGLRGVPELGELAPVPTTTGTSSPRTTTTPPTTTTTVRRPTTTAPVAPTRTDDTDSDDDDGGRGRGRGRGGDEDDDD